MFSLIVEAMSNTWRFAARQLMQAIGFRIIRWSLTGNYNLMNVFDGGPQSSLRPDKYTLWAAGLGHLNRVLRA